MLALVCRAQNTRFVVSAEVVNRIFNAATWLPLSGLPRGAMGVLNVAGENLVVVDPRIFFAQPVGTLALEHHLIELNSPRRFLLWVDAVETSLEIDPAQIEAVATSADAFVKHLVRFADETLPLIDVAVLDPGDLISQAA